MAAILGNIIGEHLHNKGAMQIQHIQPKGSCACHLYGTKHILTHLLFALLKVEDSQFKRF